MKEMICSQEMAVARAARSGHWDTALKSHADDCPACKEVVQTVLAMQSLAAPAAIAPMPDADLLWRKALLEQRQAAAQRAQRPLRIAEYASLGVIALALSGWLAWYWPALQPQLAGWPTSLLPALWQAAWFLLEANPSSVSALAPSAWIALLAVAVTLAAYPLLAED
jgi:hypothetical protein